MYTKDELLKKRAELSATQLALVQRRMRRENAPMADSMSLTRRPPGELIQLSFAQQRLWFLQQLVPESTAYNELIALRLEGVLNRDALVQAMHALMQRHEILRTTFPFVEDTPCQVITPADHLEIEVPFVDLQAAGPAEREAQVHYWTHTHILRPFLLTEEWPWRTCVLCLGAHEYIFLVCMHHSITDAWSLELFVTELMALYRSWCTGQPSTLTETAFQYADYACWQRQTLTEERLRGHMDYWRSQLAGPLPALELQTDHPRPAFWTHRGQRQAWSMPQDLCQRLRQWSRQENATLFMVLLAALTALLYRYTMQEDIIVGTSIAGRLGPEVEKMLGCFVNNLALRTDLSGNPSFRELVRRVRQVALEAYDHQELPFEKLVEELQPVRDFGRNPIFQVMLVLQNMPMATIDLSDLRVQAVDIETITTRFDLSLVLQESSQGVQGYVEYNSDLFDRTTIERLMDQYLRVLSDGVAHPERRISDLALLSPLDEWRMLVDWNPQQPEGPPAPSWQARHCRRASAVVRGTSGPQTTAGAEAIAPTHHQFEDQAARTPDAVAVLASDEHLSYRELNERANQLAHYLRTLHVGPESLVGLCVERSAVLLVGILGILKAGGAYVPLDPACPPERLALLVQDAGTQIVLTQERLLHQLPSSLACALCLDRDWPHIACQPTTNPQAPIHQEQLVYMIYTSGSTGRPKGVQITHRNLALSTSARGVCYPDAPARYLLLSSFAFDSSAVGIFWTLSQGGTLVLPSDDIQRDPGQIARLVEQRQISHMCCVPPLYTLLLEQAQAASLASLRLVIVAGEACPPSLVEMHQNRAPHVSLSNEYGPTEATVWSSFYLCGETPKLLSVPIGRPRTGTQMYLLDRFMHPVPIGAVGEIYIGGDGVGRGYLKRADVTAACFVPHPFSARPGARLYRTGDLGRAFPDGTIEFMGRRDNQVKIRGFRIEPGEIEAALMLHAAISSALVTAREDVPGDKRLVAYLTLVPERYVSPQELRRFLEERLPPFMLPSAYVYLERLPALLNGKVDRRALPAPDQGPPEPGTDLIVARDPVTELLSGIWSQVLRVAHVGLNEEFFALGGHSLLAVQVASRVRATFGVELPLQVFFLTSTLAAQAEYIQQALQGTETAPPPAPVAGSYDRPLPLSFTQQRQWLLDQLDPDSRLYTLFGALRLHGQLSISALEQSLREIIRRHAILRTIFLMQGEELAQVIKPDIAAPFTALDLRGVPEGAQEAAIAALATQEQQWTWDLAQGPLLRMTVVSLGEEDHVLMLVCHHILLDGWSLEVFLHELATHYAAFLLPLWSADHSSPGRPRFGSPCPPTMPANNAQGEPSPLPELPIQYADYARWQREVVCGAYLEHLLAYWRRRLANLPVFTLPAARSRPAPKTFRAARVPISVPAALTESIKALCRREGVTLFMALLTAFQATLARYSGQDDIVVGSPTANRNRAELEPVLGNFINTLVLRTDLAGNPTFHTALQRVREVALEAYAHQDLPFEKLMQELHPERDPDRNPLFQVLFAFQNTPEQKIAIPGLTASSLQFGDETTTFDLDLTMWEREGELLGGLKYNTDLFDEALITLMRNDLLALLDLMVTDVHLRIADRSLLAEDEQARLQRSWNATYRDYEREATLHQLFERQVERAPDAIAVVFEDQALTYQQVNEQANQLAHHLRSLKIGPGAMVAIVLERSLEMIPALLAVLKAGACYVPLEPDFPDARIQWILSTLKIRAVLTQSPCLHRLAQLAVVRGTSGPQATAAGLPALRHIVCLDSAAETGVGSAVFQAPVQVWTRQALMRYALSAGEGSRRTNPQSGVSANALAYVIFTSGSTGRPKGVMVRHQPVVNLIEWVNRTFAMGATDRVLFVTSLCFDLSVYDIFGLLAAGGSIQVVASPDLRDPERLHTLLTTAPITFWDSAPAALQMLPLAQQDRAPENGGGLRLVFLSGDWIPIKLPDRVRAAFPGAEVVSLGGATEATVWSNFFRVGEVAAEWVSIPYGKPIQNASYHILDAYLNPRPIGVPGDLYIGGECLATGYIGEPELTAQRFIPSPYSEQPGMRLYKTGDLARYWPDGTIEFLGRSDTQVKIRGFRIELGEIEATLTRHPGVQVAVADARRDASGEKSLVAYVVPRLEQAPDPADLRAYLQTRLPAYMLPSSFVLLDALPVTANGKVDRQRLPELEEQAGQWGTAATVAPRTPIEEQMAALWMDALKLARISIHDDFFLVGGHSLLAVQLIARIRAAWQISLPLRDLFAYPTVAALSERVAARVQAEQAEAVGAVARELEAPTRPWYEDAVLDADFPAVVTPHVEQGRALQHVFLTNATGLLGSSLLVELLQKTSAQVSCLVRGRDEADGRRRIRQALEQDHLWRDEFSARIVPVCGDLEQPLLGLPIAAFERLALEIDCIYHNGALFSSVLPYEEISKVNVRGAREVLRLACQGDGKPIHYVSTLGVLSPLAVAPGRPLMEGDALENHRDAMLSGYDQSKWCAEKIMHLAYERCMPVTIYRPGRLTGHSRTGAWRIDDLVCRQIKGCIQLGGVPAVIFGDQLEMTPVDYVSQAIVALSLQSHGAGKVFHLLNTMNTTVERLVAWLNEFGYPVEQQTYRVWRAALQQAAEQRSGNVLAPFLESYPEPAAEEELHLDSGRAIYDDRQTQAALAGAAISCPPIDRQLIHSYLQYFVKIGFLPVVQKSNV